MKNYRRFLPYGVALGTMAIALLLTFLLESLLTHTIGVFFFVAITITTWYGGLRSGFMAIALSTLAINIFFVPPLRQFTDLSVSDLIRFASFSLVAIVINILSNNLRASQQRLEQISQKLLEESADHLKIALKEAQTSQALLQQQTAFLKEKQESEAKYRHLIEHLNAGFVIHAPDTHILQCNTTACDLLGLSMDQMLGKTALYPAWHFVCEDGTVMPIEEYPVNLVLSTQIPLENYVLGINRESQSRAWVLVSGFPEFDAKHQLKQVVVTFIDISKLKQAEALIAASLKEKEVLLKEIHHRVKNNLGIVSSLLQMQIRRIQNTQAAEILQDSHNRIASIALVHEKLYRSENLANIDSAQYIRDLTVYLFDSYNISSNQIKLNIQVEDTCLDIETIIPCGLIINEVVSNALKHAFPNEREGEILVRFFQSNQLSQGQCQCVSTLIVKDNGIGLSPDFDIKKYKTLGMTLVQGLAKQIGGTIEFICQQGTEFKLTFIRRPI